MFSPGLVGYPAKFRGRWGRRSREPQRRCKELFCTLKSRKSSNHRPFYKFRNGSYGWGKGQKGGEPAGTFPAHRPRNPRPERREAKRNELVEESTISTSTCPGRQISINRGRGRLTMDDYYSSHSSNSGPQAMASSSGASVTPSLPPPPSFPANSVCVSKDAL